MIIFVLTRHFLLLMHRNTTALKFCFVTDNRVLSWFFCRFELTEKQNYDSLKQKFYSL